MIGAHDQHAERQLSDDQKSAYHRRRHDGKATLLADFGRAPGPAVPPPISSALLPPPGGGRCQPEDRRLNPPSYAVRGWSRVRHRAATAAPAITSGQPTGRRACRGFNRRGYRTFRDRPALRSLHRDMLDLALNPGLKALVERYIADSDRRLFTHAVKQSGLELSPATIPVMADLEELGFIASPHTSAGRVPTRGYRFVDTLLVTQPLQQIELREAEARFRAAAAGN